MPRSGGDNGHDDDGRDDDAANARSAAVRGDRRGSSRPSREWARVDTRAAAGGRTVDSSDGATKIETSDDDDDRGGGESRWDAWVLFFFIV